MSDTSFKIEEGTFPLLIYIPINQNLPIPDHSSKAVEVRLAA